MSENHRKPAKTGRGHRPAKPRQNTPLCFSQCFVMPAVLFLGLCWFWSIDGPHPAIVLRWLWSGNLNPAWNAQGSDQIFTRSTKKPSSFSQVDQPMPTQSSGPLAEVVRSWDGHCSAAKHPFRAGGASRLPNAGCDLHHELYAPWVIRVRWVFFFFFLSWLLQGFLGSSGNHLDVDLDRFGIHPQSLGWSSGQSLLICMIWPLMVLASVRSKIRFYGSASWMLNVCQTCNPAPWIQWLTV